MKKPLKILFDFDGTLCRVETIPFVASKLNIPGFQNIEAMTALSCSNNEDYEENFRKRVSLMKEVSVEDFVNSLSKDLLRPEIEAFIANHRHICEIASCNLDCWCFPLASQTGVRCNFSSADIADNDEAEANVAGVREFLDKRALVGRYQAEGYFVVFVGDSANDLEAMERADMAVLIDNGNLPLSELNEMFLVAGNESELIEILNKLIETK